MTKHKRMGTGTRGRSREDKTSQSCQLGYSINMQDSLHLSRSRIQPYNQIQYNRFNFKRAVPLAAIKVMAPVAALYLCHIMFITLVQLTNPFFIPAFFSASVHFLPIQTNIPVLPQSRIKQSYNDINRLIKECGYFL